ncbi:hypothetical protein BTM_3641 [Burkholderia thailandensis 34]|uniref:hypothetical protein n=1 Tax=Burkholderia thailandensis TaxID=57975 RepID=UPI0005D96D59|nr:hypothetical protein [Burkholderia thailandensis]AJY31650.1 hypothetical protein BTM_3641 [Burkholderia thailandensis 34]AOJ59370.1 hypothetical protein AQ477_22730 [Burkholderia thailandensis]KXF58491.1 hypothetical protein AQ476_27860 [Burkholderia thailandensis]
MISVMVAGFVAGIVIAVAIRFSVSRGGAGKGLSLPRDFDRRGAVRCTIEPVALRARLLPSATQRERRDGQ